MTPVAFIEKILPPAYILRADGSKVAPVVGMPLYPGDTIVVEQGGFAEVKTLDERVFPLFSNEEFLFEELSEFETASGEQELEPVPFIDVSSDPVPGIEVGKVLYDQSYAPTDTFDSERFAYVERTTREEFNETMDKVFELIEEQNNEIPDIDDTPDISDIPDIPGVPGTPDVPGTTDAPTPDPSDPEPPVSVPTPEPEPPVVPDPVPNPEPVPNPDPTPEEPTDNSPTPPETPPEPPVKPDKDDKPSKGDKPDKDDKPSKGDKPDKDDHGHKHDEESYTSLMNECDMIVVDLQEKEMLRFLFGFFTVVLGAFAVGTESAMGLGMILCILGLMMMFFGVKKMSQWGDV